MKNTYSYTTDGRVGLHSRGEEINTKLGRIIGRRFTDYRKRWDAASAFEIETTFPLFIQLDMNQTCNLSCVQCPLDNFDAVKHVYGGNELKFSDYKRIVDEGQEHNCPSLSPSGLNEPLLMKDLEEYISYAEKKGFIDIILVTNGTALTEKRAKKLLDSGLTRIRFSLDAVSRETYEKIRGSKNYDKVIRNISRFIELKEAGGYKLPVTGANLCKINLNSHETDKFYDYWIDKVDTVAIQQFTPTVPDAGFEKYYPDYQFNLDVDVDQFQCPQPQHRVVLRNNYITPCCGFHTDLIYGDIRVNTIYEIWNGPGMKALRKAHKDKRHHTVEACKICVKQFYPEGDKYEEGLKVT